MPPVVELLSVVVVLSQPLKTPVIDPGKPFTVTTVVLRHPVDESVYEIVDVPAPMPVIIPPGGNIEAIEGVLVDHTPPGVASVRVWVEPTQTVVVPLIAAGVGCTVIVKVALQPVATVYATVVVPAIIPVTTPVPAFTEATPGVPIILHAPPADASVRFTVAPSHTAEGPDITAGVG